MSDLELTAACLDIKQIQTLGAVTAAAPVSRAGNHLENYHTSLDTSPLTTARVTATKAKKLHLNISRAIGVA